MKKLNEVARMQQLAGINEGVKTPISEDVKEYLLNLYDQVAEDNDGLNSVIIPRDEFGTDDYTDYEMYSIAYNAIKENGGKVLIDDFDPEMEFSIEGENILLKYIL